jgi:hypothetical protein
MRTVGIVIIEGPEVLMVVDLPNSHTDPDKLPAECAR